MTDFAAAVQAFEAALERFDAPSAPAAPRPQRLVDAGPLLEQMAIERETAMAASTSKARRTARPVASLAPRPYRRNVTTVQGTSVEDALRRLGKGTEREIGAAAGVSHNTVAARLRRMEREGTARRAGGGETRGTGGGRTPLMWEAAVWPREVEEMPRRKKVSDEQILDALGSGETVRTVDEVATKAGCSEETAGDVLRRLEKAGKVTWARGLGRGGPKVWRLFDVPPETGKAPCVSAKVEIVGKEAAAFCRGADAARVAKVPTIGDLIEQAVQREAKRLAASILSDAAHRLMVEAEAAGGGT